MRYFKGLLVSLTFLLGLFFVMPSVAYSQKDDGGGKGKKKLKVDDKAGEKEKKVASTKPSKTARASAKEAKEAMRWTARQVRSRAKVRMFFHNMFNAKPGKVKNYRKNHKRNKKPYRGRGLFRK